MRTVLLAALALLGLVAAPASADVTVTEPLPGNCRGTYGVHAGPHADAWVGSGHPTAAGPCYLHVFVDTPTLGDERAALALDCLELEWDTGVTHYLCVLRGDPDCGLLSAGEYGPGSQNVQYACVPDDVTAA